MSMMGGPPAGSPFAGPTSSAANAAAGLPFAGVPEELRERAEAILATESDHPRPEIAFDPVVRDHRRFGLRRLLAPRAGAVVVAVVLVIVETVTSLVGPLLFAIGIDRGVQAGDRGVLLAVTAAYLGSIAVNVAAGRARIAFTGRLGEDLMYDLRVKVFGHFQRLSLDFFGREKSGVLLSRMTSDIDSLTALMQEGYVNLIVQGLTLALVAGILFTLNPLLAAILLLGVVPLLLVLTLWFRSASDQGYNRVRDRIADVLADLQEGLAGVRVIVAANRTGTNVVRHRRIVGRYRDANLYTARIGATYGPASEAVGYLGQALVLLIGGRMVLDGTLTIGELTAFILYLATFFAPIQQLVQLYTTYQQGAAAVRKLGDVLATEPSVPEDPGAVELPPIEGAITFESVTFGYHHDHPVLFDLDLEIPAGSSLALVGPTGAGKSTVAKLITRFYDPTAGRVLIDGHDLREVTLASLRRQLGVVPQEPFLFHGTIRDNVAFARTEAYDAEVEAACRQVGLGPLIDRLPGGIDAAVHERGASLSAGERQLLALARAFLARPRVLVLDEATSNLDLRSEASVEAALDVVLEGRTSVIIAHRLATAMRADRVGVIEGGRLIELGTHDELVAAGGHYAEMVRTWQDHLGVAR
jgi:ATP-binding cassette, subfamily B, bacterial